MPAASSHMRDRDRDRGGQPRGVLPSLAERDPAAPVDPEAILDDLDALQVYAWERRETGETAGPDRLGPAAEEFHDAFDVGEDPDRLAAGDTDGVAIAAVQGLADRVDEQRERLQRQADCIDRQRSRLADQRDDIERLRQCVESLQADLVDLRQRDDG